MSAECPVVRFSRDPSTARIDGPHESSPDYKLTDCVPPTFGVFYVICIALSIITYILDLGLASLLLYFYSVNGLGAYFALTVTFLLVPALFMTTVSLRWYIADHDDSSLRQTSLLHWIVRIVFLLLQLAPLLRYIDTLIYGLKSRLARHSDHNDSRQTRLYRRMLDEDSNSSLLRLIHCFLHAAPQAIIQLVILLTNIRLEAERKINIDLALIQAWTVLTSLISIAWSLTSYHRSVRYARDDKDKIKWSGTLIAFCWHLMSVLSRVLALSMLATMLPVWMGCVCALHWGVMSIWLALGQYQTTACSTRCEELILAAGLGLAYVMAFISPRDGPTRYVYLAYYLVCFMENTGALVVWCVTNNSYDNPLLYYGAAGAQLVTFLLAITFLLIYYKYCHPAKAVHSKIPQDVLGVVDKPYYSKSYNVRAHS